MESLIKSEPDRHSVSPGTPLQVEPDRHSVSPGTPLQIEPKHRLILRERWVDFTSPADIYIELSNKFFYKAKKRILSQLKFFYHIFEDDIILDKYDGLDLISLCSSSVKISEKIFDTFYIKLSNFYFGWDTYKTSIFSFFHDPRDQLDYLSMLNLLVDPTDFAKYQNHAASIFRIEWSKGFWNGIYATFESISHLKFLFHKEDIDNAYKYIFTINPNITYEEIKQLQKFFFY
jgi:hypothetical protein